MTSLLIHVVIAAAERLETGYNCRQFPARGARELPQGGAMGE